MRADQRAARRGEINHALFDRFAVLRALFGGLLALLRAPLRVAVGAAVGWELLGRPLKNRAPALFPSPQDTGRNALGDAAAVLAGWLAISRLAQAFRRRRVPRAA